MWFYIKKKLSTLIFRFLNYFCLDAKVTKNQDWIFLLKKDNPFRENPRNSGGNISSLYHLIFAATQTAGIFKFC